MAKGDNPFYNLLGHFYKLLLQYDTEIEQVKTLMVKWMQNFDKEISFQQWKNLWMENIKFTPNQALKRKLVQDFFFFLLVHRSKRH